MQDKHCILIICTFRLAEEYFAWVIDVLDNQFSKGATASGFNYSINQIKCLRAFLNDGEIPINNSASERSIRTFCVGKKNWVLMILSKEQKQVP